MKQKLFFCKVCSDDATAIHYGVETCEACKVFFRRFLDKYTKYSYLCNNNCEIDKNNQNNCKNLPSICRRFSFKSCDKCTLVHIIIIMNKILLLN
jgi:hypothetical protein